MKWKEIYMKAWNLGASASARCLVLSYETSGVWVSETASWTNWTMGLILSGIAAPPCTAQTPAANSNWRCCEKCTTQQVFDAPGRIQAFFSGMFSQILPILCCLAFKMLSLQAPKRRDCNILKNLLSLHIVLWEKRSVAGMAFSYKPAQCLLAWVSKIQFYCCGKALMRNKKPPI